MITIDALKDKYRHYSNDTDSDFMIAAKTNNLYWIKKLIKNECPFEIKRALISSLSNFVLDDNIGVQNELIDMMIYYNIDVKLALLRSCTGNAPIETINRLIGVMGNEKCASLTNDEGDTPIHLLSLHTEWVDTKKIQLFIDSGVNLNAKNNMGKTAFMYIVSCSNHRLMNYLIDKVDVSAVDLLSRTAIDFAFNNFNADIIIEKEIEKESVTYNTLNFLLKRNRFSELKRLSKIEGKDYINIKDPDGNTILFKSMSNISKFKRLVTYGANVNIKNNKGETVLFYATQRKSINITEFLIRKGIDVNIPNNKGETVIFNSLNNEQLNALLNSGLNINHENLNEETFIFNVNIKVNILDKINDLNHTNKEGYTALETHLRNNFFVNDRLAGGEWIQESSKEKFIEPLLQAGAKINESYLDLYKLTYPNNKQKISKLEESLLKDSINNESNDRLLSL